MFQTSLFVILVPGNFGTIDESSNKKCVSMNEGIREKVEIVVIVK